MVGVEGKDTGWTRASSGGSRGEGVAVEEDTDVSIFNGGGVPEAREPAEEVDLALVTNDGDATARDGATTGTAVSLLSEGSCFASLFTSNGSDCDCASFWGGKSVNDGALGLREEGLVADEPKIKPFVVGAFVVKDDVEAKGAVGAGEGAGGVEKRLLFTGCGGGGSATVGGGTVGVGRTGAAEKKGFVWVAGTAVGGIEKIGWGSGGGDGGVGTWFTGGVDTAPKVPNIDVVVPLAGAPKLAVPNTLFGVL